MTWWKSLSAIERFEVNAGCHPDAPMTDQCVIWNGSVDKDGYARFRTDKQPGEVRGRYVMVTRWLWERHHGPIASGLVVRHSCDTPSCVNRRHHLLGTPAQNSQDMVDRQRHPGRQLTRCSKRHEFTPENTITRPNGTRACRTCHNARRRKGTP